MYPQSWQAAATTHDTPCLNDLHAGVDHRPVLLSLEVECATQRRQLEPKLDVAAACTPEGQRLVQAAFATAPVVPWEVDSTRHLDILHGHLHAALQHLPRPPVKPRNPALTPATIELVVHKRHVQRCLCSIRKRTQKAALRLAFRTWRDPGAVTAAEKRQLRTQQDQEATWVHLYQEARQQLNLAMQQDRAAFARRNIELARKAGPKEFAYRLRAILRTGRKFRNPPLVPSLALHKGAVNGREPVLDEFARFFALPERAAPVPIRALLSAQDDAEVTTRHFDGEQIPSMTQLACAFAKLKPGKAPGISKLPSEIFRIHPTASAAAVWPILAKTVLRDSFPFQWRGGAAAAVPKPGKASNELEGYRSVLLLEPTAKAVQTAMRPCIQEAFIDLRSAVHYGGLAGSPITLPAVCTRAHLQYLNAQNLCGGALFLDCKAAYYSVAREVLTASPDQLHNDEWVWRRAAIFFDGQADRAAFVEALRAHDTPAHLAQRPVLAAFLRKQLTNTWFLGRSDATCVMRAESGTAPGSPIADLLFGLVFQRFLHLINHTLEEAECRAFPAFSEPEQPDISTPTWADDVCILFQTARPQDLEPTVCVVMAAVYRAMRQQGLEANLGVGKTEAMLVIKGQGSRDVRRQLLTRAERTIAFSAGSNTAKVRIVPEYTHLGCLLRADGSDLPGLAYRERQAQIMYRPLRKRLFNNQFLSETEKVQLLISRVLSSYMHGAGLLTLRSSREQAKFEDVIWNFYRGAFRPIVHVSSTGYSNLEVATVLGLALPSEMLQVARACTLADIVRADLRPVLLCLEATQTWWQQALQAAYTVGLLSKPAVTAASIQGHLITERGAVSRLCRGYYRRRIQSRAFDRANLIARSRQQQR